MCGVLFVYVYRIKYACIFTVFINFIQHINVKRRFKRQSSGKNPKFEFPSLPKFFFVHIFSLIKYFYLHLSLLATSSDRSTGSSACLKCWSVYRIKSTRKTVFKSTDRSYLQRYNLSKL